MKIVENKRHYLHFTIAGFAYHNGCEVFDKLHIGTKLQLVREDENAFDSNAVAIFYQDQMLGYVPRAFNSELALLLDMGHGDIFEARVQSLNPMLVPEEQVGVIIYVLRYA